MTKLKTETGFADPDAAFRMLIEAHRGLGTAASAELNARLALLLANHIGDADVLRQALDAAKRAGAAAPEASQP